MKMNTRQIICKGLLAGMSISMGCLIFLTVGGLAGACLFSVGLLTVMWHGLLLYTGRSGDVQSWADMRLLMLTLLLNIVGCAIFAYIIEPSEEVRMAAEAIVARRAQSGIIKGLANGIACGLIMTLAVHSARKQHYWPMLIGIPAFIMAGFTHSVADAFYYAVGYKAITAGSAMTYILTATGNFIGCNLYRSCEKWQ